MPSGTGTSVVAQAVPDRFFDVGIAEGHAVTFAAGLATRGLRPVVAIYSTFLQRGYDNIIHDVAIQSLPVVFCMDRAGLVGEDGETHMGLYDIAYMLAVPNMTVTAPRGRRARCSGCCGPASAHDAGPFCLRYPRATVPDDDARDGGHRAGAVRHVGRGAPRRRSGHPRRGDDGRCFPRRRRCARRRGAERHRGQLPLSQTVRRDDAHRRAHRAPSTCWWWRRARW